MKIWFRQHIFYLGCLALFCASLCFFIWLQSASTFADPDSFYHVKIAERIASGEDVREFPWLPFTVLDQHFADQHFLYHVVLAPFVHFLDPFAGAKFATALIAAGFIASLAFFFRTTNMRFPLGFAALAALCMPLVFRLNLVKAPGFSLLLLFIGLMFAWKGRYWLVLIVSALYAMSYGGFLLLPLCVGVLAIVRMVSTYVMEREWLKEKNPPVRIAWHIFLRRFFERNDVRVLLFSLVGVCVGVVLHPSFPDNLPFLREQLLQIGLVNYQNLIGVGGEWYPYKLQDLLGNTSLITILLGFSFALGLMYPQRLTRRTVFFTILWVLFFALTLKSRRYVEYYVPFALSLGASVLSDVTQHVRFRLAWQRVINGKWTPSLGVVAVFIVYCVGALGIILPRQIPGTKADLSGGFPYTKSADAILWLEDNAPDGAVIVHSDWDEFPYLMYWHDQGRYIAGLDPTFLYRADQDTYWAWVNMTMGKTQNISEVSRAQFGASYIFIENDHADMLRHAKADPGLRFSYADSQAHIFTVIQEP